MAPDDPMQAVIGPLEHREVAADTVRRNPVLGFPAMLLGTPAYTAGKAAGLFNTRSPASVDEIFAGWEGSVEGLRDALRR